MLLGHCSSVLPPKSYQVQFVFPFHRRGSWGSERGQNLPNAIQPISVTPTAQLSCDSSPGLSPLEPGFLVGAMAHSTSLRVSGGGSRLGVGWGALIRKALSRHRIGFIDLYVDFWNPIKAQKRESSRAVSFMASRRIQLALWGLSAKNNRVVLSLVREASPVGGHFPPPVKSPWKTQSFLLEVLP